jgi:hypothetical protein
MYSKEVPFDIVIGHSASDQFRDRNLRYVISYYLRHCPGSRIIIIEQHSDTDLSEFKEFKRVYYRKIDPGHPEYYSRSAGFNAGMEIVRKEMVLLVDNDCIVIPPILNNIKSIMGERRALIPYNYCKDLSQNSTDHLIKTHVALEGTDRGGGKDVCYGGAMFIYTDSYWEIGGYDEGFIGWGAEDTAFQHKAINILGLGRISGEYPMFHMWHPTASSKEWRLGEQYKKNVQLLNHIKSMDKDQLLEYVKEYKKTYSIIN